MDTNKIAKKYCTNDKVQVMFSNASQIICSKDGYLYLRNGNITIHKYLSDPQRSKMPYHNNPVGKWHATHLFKYDQVYIKFTKYRRMNDCVQPMPDSYSLSFLYFHKNSKGETICSEMYLSDFEKRTNDMTLSKEELKNFLYETTGIKGKYILDKLYGIEYAKSVDEKILINKSFLDLSDSSIVNLYNLKKKPMNFQHLDEILGTNKRREKKDDTSWKISSLNEITEEFCITSPTPRLSSPFLIEVTDTTVNVFEFEVFYCKEDCFKVKYKKTSIIPNLENILVSAENSNYSIDPSFDE